MADGGILCPFPRAFGQEQHEHRKTAALVVGMIAKPETRDEVAEFLTGAVELANAGGQSAVSVSSLRPARSSERGIGHSTGLR